jgi:hypothetical protein
MKALLTHYWDWKISRCGFCGRASHWATDGRNLFCAHCGICAHCGKQP